MHVDKAGQEQIYVFDRQSGALRHRIEGLPAEVDHLVFSPDGTRMAAMLGSGGLRVYARESGWQEIAHDEDYGDDSYGADFAADGRLVTTSFDGKVRLYPPGLAGEVRPSASIEAPGGEQPYGIAFNPDGAMVAVGYDDIDTIDRLDGYDLSVLSSPSLNGFLSGNLPEVAWSRDGLTLFAGGWFRPNDSPRLLTWDRAGEGFGHRLLTGIHNVTSLVPLPDRDVLITAADPYLARTAPDGANRWPLHGPPAADFRDQYDRFLVSADGMRVGFGYNQFGISAARFDVGERSLSLDPASEPALRLPRQIDLPIDNWHGRSDLKLAGRSIRLRPHEISRALAIHPDLTRFVVGSDWFLRAFGADGSPLWTRPVPGTVRAVNITGMAGWSLRPMATAPSAGTAWRTGWNCSPSCL
jgi:hypothetical protein